MTNALTSVDLVDATLQARQDPLKLLVPTLPSTPVQPNIQYRTIPPVLTAPLVVFNPPTGPSGKWDNNLQNFMRLCNVTAVDDLPQIWRTIAPLSRDRARPAMEAVCRKKSNQMRFRAPRITHAVVAIVLVL